MMVYMTRKEAEALRAALTLILINPPLARSVFACHADQDAARKFNARLLWAQREGEAQ